MRRYLWLVLLCPLAFAQGPGPVPVLGQCVSNSSKNCTPKVNAAGAYVPPAGSTLPSGPGLVRVGSGVGSASELSGDATTNGSNAVTVVKVNGASLPASATGLATNSSGQIVAAVADTTVTVGTGAISANTCSGSPSTVSMPGLLTTMTVQFTPNSDVSAETGWSPGTGGQLYFTAWPSSAGTLSYYVCNPTSSSITPGSSTTWNVSAR
jgi:hypothetical protein